MLNINVNNKKKILAKQWFDCKFWYIPQSSADGYADLWQCIWRCT